MAGGYQTVNHTPKRQFRRFKFRAEEAGSAVLASGNGTTNFGEIEAGTVMGQIGDGGSDDGKIRPFPLAKITNAVSAGVAVETADASAFYVGDTVSVLSADGVEDAVTIAAGDNPSNLTVQAVTPGDSRIKVKLTDPSANSQPLKITITDDGADVLLDVSLATDGGGSITSTVQEVADILTGTALVTCPTIETAADLAQAVAATALTGGVAVGGAIASARTVSAVDKTSSPNTVTVSGANFDTEIGDYIHLDDMTLVEGVLEDHVDTVRRISGTDIAEEKRVAVGLGGYVTEAQLVGLSDALKAYMAGGHVDEILGELHQYRIGQFSFR